MHQLLIRLPEHLLHRLRQAVPLRQRSAFVQRLLEDALPPVDEDDRLAAIALAVEQDEQLNRELAGWDVTAGDGLE